MDATVVTALASAAGSTMIGLLVTPDWNTTRNQVLEFCRRVNPDRIGEFAGALETDRASLLSANAHRPPAEIRTALSSAWTERLRALIRTSQDMDRLAALVAILGTTTPNPDRSEPTVLTVLEDHAALRYDDDRYTLTQRRKLFNTSGQAVPGYLVRIEVDRFPDNVIASQIHHHHNPLD